MISEGLAMRCPYMKMKQKLIIAIAISVILPTLTVSLVGITKTTSQSTENFVTATQNEIRQIENGFLLFFDQVKASAKFLAQYPTVKAVPENTSTYMGSERMMEPQNAHPKEAQIYELYTQFGQTHEELLYVYLGTKNGGFIQYPAEVIGNYDPRKRPWYKMGMDNLNQTGITDAYQGVTGGPMVSVMYSISDENNTPVGVQSLDVSLTTLTDIIQSIKLGDTGYVILIDDNGVVLADHKSPQNNFKKVNEINSPLFSDLKNKIHSKTNSNFTTEHRGNDVQVSTYYSKDLKWHFVGVIDRSEIMQPTYSMSYLILLIAALMVGAFIFIGLLLSQRLVAPILVVSQGLKDIANGEGDLTQRLKITSKDETGELASWFNQFLDSIRALVKDIKKDSQLLADKSEQIGQIVNNIKTSSHEQETAIESSANGTSQMARTSKDVAYNCSSTMEMVSEAELSANEGTHIIGNMVQDVSTLSSTISESTSAMKELEKESSNITQILSVIRGIAEQTNLLALNAAIEAARAGEQGRGFAVVADEVRTLAKRSHDATEEIDNMLNNLVDKTRFVSGKMDSSLSQSEQANTQSKSANKSFTDISNAVVNIRNRLDEILASADAQNHSSQQIDNNISEISNSVRGIAKSSDNLSENAHELMHLSTELNGLVGKFKVD